MAEGRVWRLAVSSPEIGYMQGPVTPGPNSLAKIPTTSVGMNSRRSGRSKEEVLSKESHLLRTVEPGEVREGATLRRVGRAATSTWLTIQR